MDRKRGLHTLTAVVGGFVVLAALISAVLLVRSTSFLTECTLTTRYGWLIPLFSGFVIVGVAWALSAQPRHGAERFPGMRAVPCEHCGKTLMGDWRLCPYCGAMLSHHQEDPAATAHGSIV